MKLYTENFDALKSGAKMREYCLNDEKRKLVKVGDTIRFVRLSDMDEEYVVDVIGIETFNNWYDCYSKYYNEDFKDSYDSVDDVVQDTYDGGYYMKEESDKYGAIVFTIKKHELIKGVNNALIKK